MLLVTVALTVFLAPGQTRSSLKRGSNLFVKVRGHCVANVSKWWDLSACAKLKSVSLQSLYLENGWKLRFPTRFLRSENEMIGRKGIWGPLLSTPLRAS